MVSTVTYQGSILRPIHLQTMQAAAAATPGWGKLVIAQGGYSHYGASAGTHAKLDVADISVSGKTHAMVGEFCKNLFECGNLPFPRGFDGDGWTGIEHIHNLWWPCDYGATSLKNQYHEFLNGGDGLVGSRKYNGPSPHPLTTWANSMFNTTNRINYDKKLSLTVVTKDAPLLGLDRYRNVKVTRQPGYQFNAVAKIFRWGRWNYLTKYETFYAEEFCTPTATKS